MPPSDCRSRRTIRSTISRRDVAFRLLIPVFCSGSRRSARRSSSAGTGAFFFAGFDALVLLIGTLTGFVVMAIALAPFYRKFGAYTVPSYLGRRFDSRALRIVAAIVAAVPMLLVLSAELRMGAGIAGRLVVANPNLIVCMIALSVAITTAAGGKRSFTWSGVAQSIALFLALLGVATAVSVIVTNLPIPQLANGPIVRGLVRNEVSEGLQLVNVWPLAFDLPGEGFAALMKPYTQPFGAIGPLGFVIGTFAIATGISAAPWLLPRVAASPGVYEARKALGWATVFSGLALLTVSSVAIFMRDFALDVVTSERLGPLPKWLFDAAAAQLVAFDQTATRLTFNCLEVRSRRRALRVAGCDRPSACLRLPAARRRACCRSRHGRRDNGIVGGGPGRGCRPGHVVGTDVAASARVDHARFRRCRCLMWGGADDYCADRSLCGLFYGRCRSPAPACFLSSSCRSGGSP